MNRQTATLIALCKIIALIISSIESCTTALWRGQFAHRQPPESLKSQLLLLKRWSRSPPKQGMARTHAKPAWVVQHILHLKVLMPQDTGVRKIAATFNRSQVAKNNTSPIRVSKTYVANILRAH